MSNAVLDMKPDIEKPKTGIDERARMARGMAGCLADSYILMVKTHGYHWNVVGPLFRSIHMLTEEHYTDMFAAVDEMAERIRALGYPAPGSITEMMGLTALQEDTGNPTTEKMVENLIGDHEIIARRFRECIERAEEAKDAVTADMLTARLAFHEKAVWMLRAILSS